VPVALLAMVFWQRQGRQAAKSQGVKPLSWKPQRKMRRSGLLMIEACSPIACKKASRTIRGKKSLRGSAEQCRTLRHRPEIAGNWGDHAPAEERCARHARREKARSGERAGYFGGPVQLWHQAWSAIIIGEFMSTPYKPAYAVLARFGTVNAGRWRRASQWKLREMKGLSSKTLGLLSYWNHGDLGS